MQLANRQTKIGFRELGIQFEGLAEDFGSLFKPVEFLQTQRRVIDGGFVVGLRASNLFVVLQSFSILAELKLQVRFGPIQLQQGSRRCR